MNELHLFAGSGGGILGGMLLGHTCVCAVEIEPYCRKVLLQRQRDGILPKFPIWDDITTFDGTPLRGTVDVVAGGFPCQDISAAGRGAGLDGKRSGLWGEMARIIREVRPKYAFVENSPLLTRRGLHRVLQDLAEMGYDARWCVLGAVDAEAPHKRERIWILAHSRHLRGRDGSESNESQFAASSGCGEVADAASIGQSGPGQSWFWGDPSEKGEGETDHAFSERIKQVWGIESGLGRVADGVAYRMDRLKAIGNGQVPIVAALAWNTLMRQIEEESCP